MAQKKKRTSVICNDWIAYTDEMDDETAGRFFKTMLAIRNNRKIEIPPDLKFIMAHIQSFWKEADAEREKLSQKQRDKANKRRGKSDSNTDGPPADTPSNATAYRSIPLNANDTDECLTVTDTNTVTKEIKKENIKEKKLKFGDFVLLTQNEHTKLLADLGEKILEQTIENLNNYIGSRGKKYKSHYHTIRAWNKDFLAKQKNKEIKKTSSAATKIAKTGALDEVIS
ncbi:hypothetical protein D8B45_07345 [Candidatus Gracilibacteria bacterium]|nr:MAG: hypothetical protein D8B45_07345 [Candidatus Gracilibacteria bacterium]